MKLIFVDIEIGNHFGIIQLILYTIDRGCETGGHTDGPMESRQPSAFGGFLTEPA